jgi:tetratricopeptide (TPR) repeat protein
MTSAVQDVWHALDAAGELPFGPERSALIESLVAQTDELGDDKLALTTRLQLMTSYSYGGEPLRRFPVFAWLLNRFAADPDLFDEDDRYRLLWMFKWVTVGVTHHPAVTRHRIEARLAEMAEHYAAAGEGQAPVLGCRFQVIALLDGDEAAEEAYQAWVAEPRTALSDCQACEPGVRVRHLVAVGRPADALAEAEPVLQFGGCADQPQRTIGYALEPLLQCGFDERAGHEHLRGVRLLRSAGGSPTTWARHIMACARGGQLRRGLDLLEDRLPDLDSAPTPWDAMWLSAAGARLLAGLVMVGDDDLPVAGAVSPTGAPATVAGLLEQLTDSARALAGRFDERNQNGTVGDRIEQWLNSPMLPELLLGDVVTRRRAPRRTAITRQQLTASDEGRPATARHGSSAPRRPPEPEPEPEPDATTVATLADRWQAALDSGIEAERAAVLRTWRRVRGHPVAAQLPSLAGARLEAALAIHALDTDAVSAHDARGAARLLREAGDPVGALLHELACLRRELVPGNDPEAVITLAGSLATKGSQLGGAASGCLQVGLVALLQEVGRPIGPAVEQGLTFFASADPAHLTAVQRGCLALLLRDRAADLDPADRELTLRRARALLGPGERVRERALVALALGTALEGADTLSEARELLADAADDAAAAGDHGLAVHAVHALGRACHLAGDPAEAVQVLRNLLAELGPDADPLLLAQARQDLAHALREGGAVVVAAELAETALDDLEDHLAQTGLTSPDDLDWVGLGTAVTRGRDQGDEGQTDAGQTDTGQTDTRQTDAGQTDAGQTDTGQTDTGQTDTGQTGAGQTDTGQTDAGGNPPRVLPEAELAGTLAFTAALFARDLGEDATASALAQRSAAWHRGYGRPREEAESLELAAHTSPDQVEAVGMLHRAGELHAREGRWVAAAVCRRELALPLLHVAGLGAAEQALASAQTALQTVRPSQQDRPRLALEQVALADQAARLLAAAGQLPRALVALQHLDTAFRALGDARSARDVVGLRAQMLEELGRAEEILTELHEAALEARSAGEERQALQLGGHLAAFLDDLGRHDEAETIWQLFTP